MADVTPEELAKAQAVIDRAAAEEGKRSGKLVDNDSDPDDLPYGNKPDEIKGPDPEQHPGN